MPMFMVLSSWQSHCESSCHQIIVHSVLANSKFCIVLNNKFPTFHCIQGDAFDFLQCWFISTGTCA